MVRAYRIYVRRGIYFFRGAIALPRRFVAEWRGGDNFYKLTLSMSFRPSVSERRNLSIRRDLSAVSRKRESLGRVSSATPPRATLLEMTKKKECVISTKPIVISTKCGTAARMEKSINYSPCHFDRA